MNNKKIKLSTLIRTVRKTIFTFILLFSALRLNAQQYNVTGTAFAMGTPGCFTLTNTTSSSGAIWNIYEIDLTQPFDITLTLNFGVNNQAGSPCGADGISFVLQPVSSGVFGIGGLVGFGGISPSLGVIMDTYQNTNYEDPVYDHISICQNGVVMQDTYSPEGICPSLGGTLVTTATNVLTSYCNAVGWPASAANPYAITDGNGHLFRFTWDPTTLTVNAYFGTSTTLPTTATITYTGDIVNNIFAGNPNVYWGVSGSTGACWNLQTVCVTTVANFVADTIVCYGTPVSFFDNSISGLPISSWNWDFGDGGTSILQNPEHTYATPGVYLVKLTIVNSGGFSSVITHNVTVNPKPTLIVTSDSVCLGDTATLTVTGGTTYYWSNGQSDSIIKVSPPITSSYIVTGQNQYYCTNTDTAYVTIFPLPDITITTDSICIGDTATLTASGGDSYQWTSPITSTANPIQVSPTAPTQYTVIGTSNTHGCKNSATAKVNFYPYPSISFLANITSGCEPLTVTFTNQTDPATSTYIWNFGDNSPTDTSTNPVHTYTNSDPNSLGYSVFSITLTATSASGCTTSFTAQNYDTVFPQPHANFTWSPPTGVLSNPIISFNNTTTPSNSLFNNIWNFGDSSAINYSQNPSHLFTSASTFNVILIVTTDSLHGNCSDTVIHSILIVDDSLIFPNIITPNGDGFNDNFVIKGLEKGGYPNNKLVIYNRWGKKVYESNDYVNGSFDGEGLPDGVYYYIFTAKSVLHEIKHQSSLEILR